VIAVSPFELEIILDIIKKHVPDCDVLAFGSRYRWTCEETSDLDLAVVGKGKVGFGVIGGMKDDFMESDLPFRVDVLDYHAISENFRKIIDAGNERIYCVPPGVKSGWKETILGEVINLKRGYDLPSYQRITGEFPIFSSSGITGYHNEFKADGNGVITGRYGTIGEVFYSDKPYWPLNTTLYVQNFKNNDPRFIYYLLKTIDFNKYSDKSAVPGINRNHIHLFNTCIPPLAEQRAIAATLSCLDDKIANNAAINHHLEQMAQAIFNEICNVGEKAILSDILNVCYGKDHKRLGEGNVPCYGSGGIMRYVDTALYNGESVLIPRKGSLNNVLYINEPFWTVDTMFYTQMTHPNVAKFVFFTVRGINLAGMNVGSAVPSMTTAVLNALEILLPSDEILATFEKSISPMFLQIQANNAESARLADLRDALLPRLMSGELSVADTMRVVDVRRAGG